MNRTSHPHQDLQGGGVGRKKLTITEWNYVEYYFRLTCLEKTFGAYRRIHSAPLYFRLDEVKQHIGLKTNVEYVPYDVWELDLGTKLAQVVRDQLRRDYDDVEEILDALPHRSKLKQYLLEDHRQDSVQRVLSDSVRFMKDAAGLYEDPDEFRMSQYEMKMWAKGIIKSAEKILDVLSAHDPRYWDEEE